MKSSILFKHDDSSLSIGWEIGLKSCGFSQIQVVSEHEDKTPYTKHDVDLWILENPSEFDLDRLSKVKKSNSKFVCIVGDEYKKFYKNHSFVDLWVEPCFYDKSTEKSFSTDGLPFHYCPLASQDTFIPFHTELYRKYDLSSDDLLKHEKWNVVHVPKKIEGSEVFYGNTKVNLNYQIPKKDFVYLNQKAFDIPMSGNFQLSTIPQIVDIFEGKVGYTSEEEMMDKIQYYIDHEEERTRMAIKGYEVCIAKHTYTYRMRDLLKKLNA